MVGLILNLINQGDTLLSGNFAGVHWIKFCLTFCVPFCVSVCSATKAMMQFDPGTRALVDAHLHCKTCHKLDQHVRRGERISECPRAEITREGGRFSGNGFRVVKWRRIRLGRRINNGWTSMLLLAGLVSSMLPAAETVFFEAEDGARIEADLSGEGEHGVVLAHGGMFTKDSWDDQVPVLNAAGFRTLAINFRGRGQSTVAPDDPPPERGRGLYPVGFSPHYRDVLAAIAFLREQGCDHVSVVGGSIGGGATATAMTAIASDQISGVVLLAATPIQSIGKAKGPKLFVTTKGDNLAGITRQFEAASNPKEMLVLKGSAHAQHIFATSQSDALIQAIITFLKNVK